MQNLGAENDLHEQVVVLQAAHRIALVLSKAQRVEDTVEKLILEFFNLAKADEGSIQLLRPASQTTRCTLVRKSQKGQGFLDSRLDDLITGLVVRHKRELLTNDLAATLDLGTTSQNYIKISSVLATPILLEQEALGAVNLIRTQPSPPFTLEDQRLVSSLAAAIAEFIEQTHWREQLFNENERLRHELSKRFDSHGILGRSAAMKEVFSLLDRVIPTDGRVLIQGESGTGKERIAKIIHYTGPRNNRPFVAVDCGALPPNLLESELFGYVRGAFTGANRDRRGLFEEANGGTLFLDEIANTNLETQAKLLRVLQEEEVRPLGSNQARKIDVRIIAAASNDLKEKITAGQFRPDLYYRLNVVPIHLPPLRERVEDIPVLAAHFLQHFAEKHGKQLRHLAAATIEILEHYPWPGNVRELENVIERAVILAESNATTLAPELLPHELSFPDMQREVLVVPLSGDLSTIVTNYEREVLLRVLRHHNWNQTEAARALNLSERMIRYKMKKLKLRRPK